MFTVQVFRRTVFLNVFLAGFLLAIGPAWSQLPWSFAENAGQYDPAVRFRAVGDGATIDFTGDEVVFHGAESSAVRLSFAGSNPAPRLESLEKTAGKANFYLGNDPSRWVSEVPLHRAITYRDLYPGVTLDYLTDGARLKSEMRLAPGADPSRIVLHYRGAEEVALDDGGSLVVRTAGELGGDATAAGEWRESPPVAWQTIDGKRIPVSARYRLLGGGRVGFALGDWDPQHELVIDPFIQFSTFLGGKRLDSATSIARDSRDNWLVSGMTRSAGFVPVALSLNPPFQGSKAPPPFTGSDAARDLFVVKLDFTLSTVIYATFLGGSNRELTSDIAVDPKDFAYITGWTRSPDFPVLGCGQCSHAGGDDDAVVVKLDPNGVPVYSTYLGGTGDDQPEDIAVDRYGFAYVTGGTSSSDFPGSGSPWFTGYTATLGSCLGWNTFVTKLDQTATSIVYSTCLGGSGVDHGRALVLDTANNAHVTGYTESANYPTLYPPPSVCVSPPCPASPTGGRDLFVATLDPGGVPSMSTYLGGSQFDQARDIAFGSGVLYVTGETQSLDFPTTAGTLQPIVQGGVWDGFVTALRATGTSFAYSTFLGGTDDDRGMGIVLAPPGGVWVAGLTSSSDFPLVLPTQGFLIGPSDAFLTHIDPLGASSFYLSTYLGGKGDDAAFALATYSDYLICLAGATGSPDLPLHFPPPPPPPGAQNFYAGGDRDGFVTCVSILEP